MHERNLLLNTHSMIEQSLLASICLFGHIFLTVEGFSLCAWTFLTMLLIDPANLTIILVQHLEKFSSDKISNHTGNVFLLEN